MTRDSVVRLLFSSSNPPVRNSRLAPAVLAVLLALTASPLLLSQGNPAGFLGGIPAYVDNDANGQPSASEGFGLARVGNTLSIGGGGMAFNYGRNSADLSAPVASRLEGAAVYSRLTNFSNRPGSGQLFTTGDCVLIINGNECKTLAFSQSVPVMTGERAEAAPSYAAIVTLTDGNSDGAMDAFVVSGPGLPTSTVNFIQNNSSGASFISIPWALASALAIKSGTPPIYLPLVGGHVSFDFNGDGFPDVDLLRSPLLSGFAATTVPTLGEWGLLALLLMLMGYGVTRLRRTGARMTLS